MKRTVLFLFAAALVALAAGVGWWAGRRGGETGTATAARKPLYYQSPMHPWIKSDKPGQCTICGMDLAPVFEPSHDRNHDLGAASQDIVMLPPGSPRITGIATAPVARRPLRRTLRVAGTIADDETRRRVLTASVRGRVDRLFVNYIGAEVAEGQPLAEFFSRELLAALAEYDLAAGPLKKTVALKLRRYGLTEGQIEALPKRDKGSLVIPLLAPMSGTVVARYAYEGQWVEEGGKLLEIADFSKMWFVFDAYERDLPWLHAGQQVEIRTPSHPGHVFTAPIAFIDPNLDETTRTARVRVELANPLVEPPADAEGNGDAGENPAPGDPPRRLFLHRLFAEATVETAAPEVLAIPRSALIWPGGKPRVFVDEGNGAYRRAYVKLGRVGDRDIEVLSGLEEGQKVVVQGGVLLDGQAQLNHGLASQEEDDAEPGENLRLVGPDDCPVSEEKLGSMGKPFLLLHEGREVRLCCKACRADFEADPGLYLRKLPNPETVSPAP